MREEVFAEVPAGLGDTLVARGFSELTAVQKAVLEPGLEGRNLRVSSQTGSGKTVAIGLVLASELMDIDRSRVRRPGPARPVTLLVAPTRELAAQIAGELSWLYRTLGVRIAVVTGGMSIRRDFDALASGPHVLVGTPGRLLDHIKRGTLDLSRVAAVVLDEADEMLDMGFRDELEGILDQTPEHRRTHLVSATFPREVLDLARRYQGDAVHVEGTAAGVANDDISHVGMVMRPEDRLDALVNVLLAAPDERTLIFVRTRVATASLAAELTEGGFLAAALSGDMGQRERTATLGAFAANAVKCLVATDVAARGLDMRDVTRVIHYDLPETAEGLTHRSGRTGRAGNKGTSMIFVPPGARRRAEQLCRGARIRVDWQNVPTAAEIRCAADARLVAEIAAELVRASGQDGDHGQEGGEGGEPGKPSKHEKRMRWLAGTLLQSGDAVDVVAALLSRLNHTGPCEPRQVRVQPLVEPDARAGRNAGRPGRGPRSATRAGHRNESAFTSFQVSWGATHGANPSRLLAMVCRRGNVRSANIGAIRIGEHRSVVEVASFVADDFAKAVRRPDARNPKVIIRRADARA